MDQVSIEKMTLKDTLKDRLSFKSRIQSINLYKGHFKRHFVL